MSVRTLSTKLLKRCSQAFCTGRSLGKCFSRSLSTWSRDAPLPLRDILEDSNERPVPTSLHVAALTEIFHDILGNGENVNHTTPSVLVEKIVEKVDENENLLKDILSALKDRVNLRFCMTLIEKLLKANKLNAAYYVFRTLRNKNIIFPLETYNHLLMEAGRNGDVTTACTLLKDLLSSKIPNSTSYFCVAKAFAKLGNPSAAASFFENMFEEGFFCNEIVVNRMIYALANTGQSKSALELFGYLNKWKCKPDLVTYNTVLDILGKAGDVDRAVHEFLSLKNLGYIPDLITYNTLIGNFSRLGKVDLSLKLFNEMKEGGLSPDMYTYKALIDSLGRMGRNKEAILLLDEMKRKGCKVSVYTYKALISNHKKSGNIQLANKLEEEMKCLGTELVHPHEFKQKKRF